MPRPALVLGAFFLSLYLLTMSGHFDSPDEELMFQVTRSLADHGTLSVDPSVSPDQLALTGVDGKLYVPYGPVSSVLSVPFYELGREAAAVLPARYSDVVERFVVDLRDALISAAACVLVYAVAMELGFGTIVAVLLSLAFGTATFAWPYAKYAWSEPVTGFWLLVAVYAAMRGGRNGATLWWSALCSVAVGLAIGSKVTAAIAVPGLLAYLFCVGRRSARARIARCAAFGLPLMLPLLALAAVNLARFGSPLETGYHLDLSTNFAGARGIAGLLVSPSKSVFLYAPVALLGVLGLRWLAVKQPWEAGLFVWLVASHLVAYGVLTIWHGDAAWGPRYLVPILPFVVLPAGALLAWSSGPARRAWWWAFRGLVVLGIAVNLGGVLVDQRVSFNVLSHLAGGIEPVEAQRWDVRLSPVLIHWNEFEKRIASLAVRWWRSASLISGTYGKENVDKVDARVLPASDLFPAWSSGSVVFELRTHGRPTELTLEYVSNRPAALGDAFVQVFVDGNQVPEANITRTRADQPLPDKRLPWIVQAKLDDFVVGRPASRVELRTPTWQPKRDAPPSTDERNLGVQIWNMQFRSDGSEVVLAQAPISPMPVSDDHPWSHDLETWFYTQPHVVDIWPWYLLLSGMSTRLLLLALLPAAGLLWSAVRLRTLLLSTTVSRFSARENGRARPSLLKGMDILP